MNIYNSPEFTSLAYAHWNRADKGQDAIKWDFIAFGQ